jgi:hypothetical protein
VLVKTISPSRKVSSKEAGVGRHSPFALSVLVLTLLVTADCGLAAIPPAAEYSKHLDALGKFSIAVAQAMPPEQYSFRPHPQSMTFGQLMAHVATTQITNSVPA